MTDIRSRHPFPDIEERAPLATVEVGWILSEAAHRASTATRPIMQTVVHPAQYERIREELETRHERRKGVATFTPHADLPEGPGLRRRLVKQRQRPGTLDVELRRLQKAQLRAKGIRCKSP